MNRHLFIFRGVKAWAALAALAGQLCFPSAGAGAATLSWTAVTTNSDGSPITDLAGYRIFQSTISFFRGGVWISTTQAMSDSSIIATVVLAPSTSSIVNLAAGTTYYFRLTAYDTSGGQSGFNVDSGNLDVQVSSFVVAGGGADTTPPTVSLTSPANGSTISGSAVQISATASDNVGVVGVQFKLDGINLGAEVLSPPYSYLWNSLPTANGAHTLTAVARDAANNQSGSSVVITVANGSAGSTNANNGSLAKEKLLTPGIADGKNDTATFGLQAEDVTIVNVRGQQVFHAAQSSPTSSIVWDCRDGSGRVLPSGIYVARVRQQDGHVAFQSFVLMK